MSQVTRHQYIVYKHLDRWRNLKAWGKSLNHVDLTVSTRASPKRAGTCWPRLQKVNVYHQPGLRGIVGMLKTGLHEFAHAVEGEDGHGHRWQYTYARAVTEVTREFITSPLQNYSVLDERCYKAVLRWWRSSGAETEAKRLLGVV